MSARLPDPLVVTTRDAGSWWKRAVDAEGHGLYARADCTDVVPELRTIRELAVFGLSSMPMDCLPVPAGPVSKPSELDRLRLRVDEVERAYTFDTAALQRRIDGLEAERHETNESLSLAAETLRENRDRIAELEAWKAADEKVQPHREATAAANLRHIAKLETRLRRVRFLHVKHTDSEHCQHDGEAWPCPTLAALDAAVGVAPTRALQESLPSAVWFAKEFSPKPAEGEHYGAVHHDYRTPRDLPELGGQR